MEYAILVGTGIIGGIIAGMLGLGGGIFYILILPSALVWFGIPAEQATPFVVANSLIGIAFASGVSIFTQFAKLKKYLSESLLVGIPAVVISVLATEFIVHRPWFSKEVFGVLVVLLMLFLLFQMLFDRKNARPKLGPDLKIHAKTGIAIGSFSGFISALTGLGGGIIINPVLHIHLHQSLQKARLIALAAIFISAVFISLQNSFTMPLFHPEGIVNVGYIVPAIAGPLIIGVIVGSPLGVRLSNRLSEKTLKLLFGIVVLMVLIEKTGSLF
ncbi:MAG: sulfite exporter TauE/SafE family protein [Bacteroidales bacterium]|nr:sulfite exporter TauE/SafE family protein [Bacteroidales bacterium]